MEEAQKKLELPEYEPQETPGWVSVGKWVFAGAVLGGAVFFSSQSESVRRLVRSKLPEAGKAGAELSQAADDFAQAYAPLPEEREDLPAERLRLRGALQMRRQGQEIRDLLRTERGQVEKALHAGTSESA